MVCLPSLSSSAPRFFLALLVSSAGSTTLGGLALLLSLRFPFSLSRSLSLCFLDFFLGFLLALLDRGGDGLVMTVEVTVRDVRGEAAGAEAAMCGR